MRGFLTGMTGADAVASFADAIMSSDGNIETGELWTLQDGWRAYMRVGQKALTLPPRTMRRLGESFRDHPDAPEDVRACGEAMIECANAAKAKNDRHEIPDGAAAAVSAQGRA